MSTYILLGTLTEDGAERLRKHPEWIDEVNRDLEKMGVVLIAQYAVLGPYDLVTLVDAPDNRSIIRVSSELSLRGSIKVVTLPAMPVEDLLSSLK
ncbi:MAG TPA: GYD domain-containing protein [Anaerolineales bacterium]|nr:GYD domain-containing protein [Anaerolineales bacterium]